MKEIKEKQEVVWCSIGYIFTLLALASAIGAIWAPKVWAARLGFMAVSFIVMNHAANIRCHDIAIKNIKEDIMQLSNACKAILDNQQELYDYFNDKEEVPEEESEADTKETVIVNPEDFERFSRGEMTKEELLGIKKAVDKANKAKTKAS